MKITFDFEARDENSAFFALYAALRNYKEMKDKQHTDNIMSIAGMEAHCMLQDLKNNFADLYNEAELEFNAVYVGKDSKKCSCINWHPCLEPNKGKDSICSNCKKVRV